MICSIPSARGASGAAAQSPSDGVGSEAIGECPTCDAEPVSLGGIPGGIVEPRPIAGETPKRRALGIILETAVDRQRSRQVIDLLRFSTAAHFTKWVTTAFASNGCG
jgi:hypothetical protein